MSTTSRSPGSAPSTAIGPESMCARFRSTSRTSLAESELAICASVHSRHSTRNSLPGRTDAAGGMSGCQRLWPGTACSAIGLDWSTEKTTSGMTVPPFSSRAVLSRRCRCTPGRRRCRRCRRSGPTPPGSRGTRLRRCAARPTARPRAGSRGPSRPGARSACALIDCSAATWSPSNPGVLPMSPYCQVHSIDSRSLASRRGSRKWPSQNQTRKSSSDGKARSRPSRREWPMSV